MQPLLFLAAAAGSFQPQPPAGAPPEAAGPGTAQPVVLFVAPGGDDARSGETEELALRTPNAARDRLRAHRAAHGGRLAGPARVVFAPGRYELTEPFVLEPQDSGTAEDPVEFVAGGPVLLSGGTMLGDWRTAELNGRAVWATDLPKGLDPLREGKPAFRSMWITGVRKTWARYPNGGGFAEVAGAPEQKDGGWMEGTGSFTYGGADAAGVQALTALPGWQGAEAVTFSKWIDTHMAVAGVEADKGLVRLATPTLIALSKGDLFCLEGAPGLLDEGGEWWCDAAARVVYYMPRPGEDPTEKAVVPRLDAVLELRGDPEKGALVEHITLRGLGVAYARWWFPAGFKPGFGTAGAVGFAQAAVGVPAAVRVRGARGVVLESCNVFACEGYGIELAEGCTGCAIRGTEVSDLGAGGIKIGSTGIAPRQALATEGNTIEDCLIEDGGHIHHQAVGVWVGQSPGNTIRNNRITRFDYTGISIGWTWGYGPSAAGGNTVEFNEVSELGQRPGNTRPPLGDMGGIYTLGSQPGTVIRNNYFHDIAGKTIAWGIYFDEGTTGVIAENNAVVNTSHGGFHQHYGKDNVLRNNIFVGGKEAALWRTRVEDHRSFVFTRNVVVGNSPTWLAGDWSKGVEMSENLYYRPDGSPLVFPGGRDLAAWQAAGFDARTVVGDPAFTDPEQGDFFPGEPTALDKIGFELVSVRRVGPRKHRGTSK